MITDLALLAGCATGLYGILLAEKRGVTGGLLTGAGAALAMLAKGLLGPGLLFVSAAISFCVLKNYRTQKFLASSLIATAIFTLMVSPWLYSLWHLSPRLFYVWLWDNNLGRFLGQNKLGPKNSHFFYLYTLPWYAFPALPLSVFFLLKGKLNSSIRVCLIFFAVAFCTLSLSSDSRELYALPLLLPLAIIAAGAAPLSVFPRVSTSIQILIVAITLILLFVGMLINVPEPFPLFKEAINYYVPGYQPHFHPGLITLALASSLATFCIVLNIKKQRTPSVLYFACLITVVWSLMMTLGLPVMDYSKRYSDVFTQLRPYLSGKTCIVSQGLGEPQRAMLQYYAGTVTLRTENGYASTQCRWFLEQHSHPGLRKTAGKVIWSGSRPGDNAEFYTLYERPLDP